MNTNTAKYNLVKISVFTLIFFLNQTLANKIEIFNVAPNFVFAIVLSASLCENNQANIYYSLAFGLLFDFFNSKILCIHGILFLLIPFFLSEIYHTYFENMISVQTLLAVVGCLTYSLLFAVFFGLRDAGFITIFLRISIVEFLYNSLIAVITIFIYRKVLTVRRSAWRVR